MSSIYDKDVFDFGSNTQNEERGTARNELEFNSFY